MTPPGRSVREASSLRLRPPNTMPTAPNKNTSTPRSRLPPVAYRMLSLLKKIPDPMTMPTIMVMAVNRPYRFFSNRIPPFGYAL
jgi:hypothetical protein